LRGDREGLADRQNAKDSKNEQRNGRQKNSFEPMMYSTRSRTYSATGNIQSKAQALQWAIRAGIRRSNALAPPPPFPFWENFFARCRKGFPEPGRPSIVRMRNPFDRVGLLFPQQSGAIELFTPAFEAPVLR
jgi:hypothetical protein